MNVMTVFQILLFTVISLALIGFCKRQLINPKSHGFYRFFTFEAIALLFVNAIPYLHHDILAPSNILSSVFLMCSLFCALRSVVILTRSGGNTQRDCLENFEFENTAKLVVNDIYKYIRHPHVHIAATLSLGACLAQSG